MPIAWNEVNEKSNGGTEMMARMLRDNFTEKELEHVQIIPSRMRELDETKHRIFWCHDLPNDPESKKALENNGHSKFAKLVFVSHWQKQQYINAYNLPYHKCTVMQNSIVPFDLEETYKDKDDGKIRMIYHTTPHRGLDIAYNAINSLCETHKNIEFNVYSSFEIYGWKDRDEEYKELFSVIDDHPNMNYHGTVSNEEVRKAVAEAHILAYPSTWPETSCISLMEGMSAKCLCVHSDLAALPETAANWTYMYNYTDNRRDHVMTFAACLDQAIQLMTKNEESTNTRLMGMKSYADLFYNWELRKHQWKQLLESFHGIEPQPIQVLEDYQAEEFVYQS